MSGKHSSGRWSRSQSPSATPPWKQKCRKVPMSIDATMQIAMCRAARGRLLDNFRRWNDEIEYDAEGNYEIFPQNRETDLCEEYLNNIDQEIESALSNENLAVCPLCLKNYMQNAVDDLSVCSPCGLRMPTEKVPIMKEKLEHHYLTCTKKVAVTRHLENNGAYLTFSCYVCDYLDIMLL